MFKWFPIKKGISSLLFAGYSKKKLVELLTAIFNTRIYVEDKTEGGSHLTYWVYDNNKKQIAVVKVVHARKSKLLTRAIKEAYGVALFFKIKSPQERLEREFEVLEVLSKQGLSPYPIKIDKGYLVEEFVYGTKLSELKGETDEDILLIVEKTLKAIKKMHENNIFHGDLRANNVLLSCNRIKFIDFEHVLDSASHSRSEESAFDYFMLLKTLLSTKTLVNIDRCRELFDNHLKNKDKNIFEKYLKMTEKLQDVV